MYKSRFSNLETHSAFHSHLHFACGYYISYIISMFFLSSLWMDILFSLIVSSQWRSASKQFIHKMLVFIRIWCWLFSFSFCSSTVKYWQFFRGHIYKLNPGESCVIVKTARIIQLFECIWMRMITFCDNRIPRGRNVHNCCLLLGIHL